MTNKTPEHTIRHFTVKAAIWANEGKRGRFFNVTFKRSYKDAENKWHDAHTFSFRDLYALILCAAQASLWISAQKPSANSDEEAA